MTKIQSDKNAAGFSLIELSIIMVVLGLLMAGFLHTYKIRQVQKEIEKTEYAVFTITDGLSKFLSRNKQYPCVASGTLDVNDNFYGEATDCTDTSVPVGSCGGGYCVTERNGQRIRIGMIPFKALGLGKEDVLDAYKNRFTYVVTEVQATSAYSSGAGTILLKDIEGGGVTVGGSDGTISGGSGSTVIDSSGINFQDGSSLFGDCGDTEGDGTLIPGGSSKDGGSDGDGKDGSSKDGGGTVDPGIGLGGSGTGGGGVSDNSDGGADGAADGSTGGVGDLGLNIDGILSEIRPAGGKEDTKDSGGTSGGGGTDPAEPSDPVDPGGGIDPDPGGSTDPGVGSGGSGSDTGVGTGGGTTDGGSGTDGCTTGGGSSTTVTPGTPVDREVDMLFFSHGRNGAGSFTSEGVWHGTLCATAGMDAENCDLDAEFVSDARAHSGEATGTYDDKLVADIWSWIYIWDETTDDSDSIYNRDVGNMGIATKEPTEKLHIADGNLRVQNADVQSTTICTDSGESCFDADLLGGGGMHCPDGEFMVGISESAPVCVDMMGTPNGGCDEINQFAFVSGFYTATNGGLLSVECSNAAELPGTKYPGTITVND